MAKTKMEEFKIAAIIKFTENEWVKFFFVQIVGRGKTEMADSKMAKFKMAEIKMAAIIKLSAEWMSLNQIELVWVRVRMEGECFWVNPRQDNKVSDSNIAEPHSKMVEFKMAEFMMATIIKLIENEWVWVRLN